MVSRVRSLFLFFIISCSTLMGINLRVRLSWKKRVSGFNGLKARGVGMVIVFSGSRLKDFMGFFLLFRTWTARGFALERIAVIGS